MKIHDPTRSRFRGMIIKNNTALSRKLRKYYTWKYLGTRYFFSAFMLPDGMIQLQTTVESSNSEEKVNNRLTEYISPRIMDLEIKQNLL